MDEIKHRLSASAATRQLFCFGFGYVAAALARDLEAQGGHAAGTRRSVVVDGAQDSPALVTFDGNAPNAAVTRALRGATHILISAPPDDAGDPVLRHHAEDIAALHARVWIGYLSSTGVYGDRDGGWVDETTLPTPTSATGRRRLAAEDAWRDFGRRAGHSVHVFRLAGIYGPERSALDQIRAGTARQIVKPGHAFSRIHVSDIIAVIQASMSRSNPGAIYNVCDDEAAPAADVIAFAAALLGVPAPPAEPFATAALAPARQRFWSENRRIANRRIKDELGVTLRYPTYREGLRALATAVK